MTLEASLTPLAAWKTKPARASSEVPPHAATRSIVEADAHVDRPAPRRIDQVVDDGRVFGSVLCAVDTSANGKAARSQGSLLASPEGTVTTVASGLLTRDGSCGLPDDWTRHDLLAVGAGAAGLAAVEDAPAPVLLARRCPLGVAVTDSIVVVVDHSPESDRAVELAGRLAAAHGGTITMLVAPRSDPALERAIARSRRVLLHATGAAPRVVGEPRPPERTVPAAAAALGASMVVLPAGRTRPERRMAAHLAGAAGCSVLMVPPVAG